MENLFKASLLIFFIISCKGGGGQGSKIPQEKNIIPSPGCLDENQDLDDPLLSCAWYLKNSGQTTYNNFKGVAGADINLGDIDGEYKGTGIDIVISDVRIDLDHEDLKNNADLDSSKNYNLPSPYLGNPTSQIDISHGTRVTGIIGAEELNGIGSKGLAPRANLIGYNFLESNQSIEKLLDQSAGGFDVYNYSYGYPTCGIFPISPSYTDMLKQGVENKSIYVTSGGNDYINSLERCDRDLSNYFFTGNSNFDQAKSWPYLISVGALNSQGKKAFYSTPGSNLWISAPGGENNGIVSTDLEGCNQGQANIYSTNPFDSNYNGLNAGCKYSLDRKGRGTSYAAPIITGIIALMFNANPDLNWRSVRYILAKTAKKVEIDAGYLKHPFGLDLAGHSYEQGWTLNQAGFNFHNFFGHGAVDAQSAINMAKDFDLDFGQLLEKEVESGPLDLPIPDNTATGKSDVLFFEDDLIIEAIQITINAIHPLISDLGIELTSPGGTKSILKNINSNIIGSNMVDVTFLSNAFYGEPSTGPWQLKILDGANGDKGSFTSWKIKVWGRY
jgi:hypothetical protein